VEIPEPAILRILGREVGAREPERDGDTFIYALSDGGRLEITNAELATLAAEIGAFEPVDSSSVATATTYEMLLRIPDIRPTGLQYDFLRRSEDPFCINDPHQGLTYTLGRPSLAFYVVSQHEDSMRETPRRGRISRMPWLRREMAENSDEPQSLVELLARAVPQWSLRITSDRKRPPKSWRRLADAFLFHLGYNMDASLIPRQWRGEIARPARVRRVGRGGLAEIDVPRRSYVSDLVYHYQLGISSDSPMLQYISFYHVMEHWFESIYHDDLVAEIQKRMTDPSFSFRRKKDIEGLIKKINRSIQLREDEASINEQVALKLTLQKYVNLEALAIELQDLDESVVSYYTSTKVSFSEGDVVDLRGSEKDVVLAALSRRIYKTRNAIVHSKDGARGRFIPYADDDALIPEIPLMRLIAEQIIIETSEDQSPV
jgi:hypothetical protein